MKVITQLVRHFWQRGALSQQEVEYLVRHGFVRERDLPGFNLPPEPEGPPEPAWQAGGLLEPHALEGVEETLVRRHAARRGAGAPKGKVLDEKTLCKRLQKEFVRRAAALESLIVLVAPIERSDSWQAAAGNLRQASAEDFGKSLLAALRTGRLTLRQVWQALDLEPLHELVADHEVRGRTARAYAALLVVRNAAMLGSYTWILKHDDMQAVSNLRVVHGHFLQGLAVLYRDQPRLLVKALAQGNEHVPAWALILLHNACRAGGACAPLGKQEYGPVPLPGDDLWRNAWTEALGMDRVRVTQLLMACYAEETQRKAPTAAAAAVQLYCPKGWHVPD